MTRLPSPESIKYSSSRLSIAEEEGKIWRVGAEHDLKKENIILNFPAELAHFFPSTSPIILANDSAYRAEAHLGTRHPNPQILIQEWVRARQTYWVPLPIERKPLRNWLKQLQPPSALSTAPVQKYWREHRGQLPFKLKDCNLRKILDTPLEARLHLGYVHGALIPRRIRENGFICWRHASAKGFRGVDSAPYLSPKGQPLDIQLHMLKWAWKNDPIKLAHTLFEMGLVQTTSETSSVTLHSHHPAIPKSLILKILGIKEGRQSSTTIAKALYRAKKLDIGGVPIQLQTNPTITPAKDSVFFLPRKRQPQELFSRWNKGIQVDEQGRYSVTPERHALHIAKTVQADVVLDAFCGCGGNTIAFARQPHIHKVISFELDRRRYQQAKQNISIYGVESKILLRAGSVLEQPPLAPFVFVDPPWEWGLERLEKIRKQFQKQYPRGMMKLPITFPFPLDSQVTLYLTEENYPSFAVLHW